MALAIRLTLSLLSLPLATIKLNGVDTTLNPILGTDKNDKLTASGESVDNITASLAGGKDLVELTAANEFDDEAESNIIVKGEDGKDVIKAVDGLLTVTGELYGNGDADVIEVARATGAVINGGQDDDTLTLGSAVDLNVAGSNATATITDSEVTGALGDDDINILAGATLDGATVKGDDGKDTIVIASGATLIDSVIAGNDGKDHISATGELTTSGSIIYGGHRKDTIEVADAGAMTVDGGKGKDFLAVGSGQTVSGGKGADTFSIEAEGGVTITDFDKTANGDCFCSDVLLVDVDALNYSSYNYKKSTEAYTSASSYAGNIKVKAFEKFTNTTCPVNAGTSALKTNTLELNALVGGVVAGLQEGVELSGNVFVNANFETPAFPATFQNQLNGNSPRPNGEVRGIGNGYGSVKGFLFDTLNDEEETERRWAIPNLTVYTKAEFEKGDFSFLDETATDKCTTTVKQKLVFDDVIRGTITNHPVIFGTKKTTVAKNLNTLKFGTANFNTITTGNANLVITKGLDDKVFYPTPNEITNVINPQDGVKANTNVTPNGKYSYTRTDKATINAGVILNLSGADFTLWTKTNSGNNNTPGKALPTYKTVNGATKTAVSLTAVNGFYKFVDIKWTEAYEAGLLGHTVSKNIKNLDGLHSKNTPAMNTLLNNPEIITNQGPNAGYAPAGAPSILTGVTTIAKGGFEIDLKGENGSLVAKIQVKASDTAKTTASLDSWLGRAQIKGNATFNPSDCEFGNPLTPEYIAAGVGGDQNNKWTPASISTSNKGVFGKKYLWTTTNANSLEVSPETCNAAFSCSVLDGAINAADELPTALNNVNPLARSQNQGFFSASKFTPVALAAEGMGDNAADANGAPFRVLFFDSKGTDNGLYVMSGTANYKNGNVTAINTNPTASSVMGGKHTIVKVTGGKAVDNGGLALSDINFV